MGSVGYYEIFQYVPKYFSASAVLSALWQYENRPSWSFSSAQVQHAMQLILAQDGVIFFHCFCAEFGSVKYYRSSSGEHPNGSGTGPFCKVAAFDGTHTLGQKIHITLIQK